MTLAIVVWLNPLQPLWEVAVFLGDGNCSCPGSRVPRRCGLYLRLMRPAVNQPDWERLPMQESTQLLQGQLGE